MESLHSDLKTKESNSDSSTDHRSGGQGVENIRPSFMRHSHKMVFDSLVNSSLCMPQLIRITVHELVEFAMI